MRYLIVPIYLLLQIVFACDAMSQVAPPATYPNTIKVNHVRTWQANAPEQNEALLIDRPLRDVVQSTQYLDGLGRPLQTVIKKGSLVTNDQSVDLVMPITYDEFGRESYNYLPYASYNINGNASTNDGYFKLNPFQQQAAFYNSLSSLSPIKGQGETFLYGKTNFEPSPLNRPMETFAPGNSWAGTSDQALVSDRRSVKVKYCVNTIPDDVKIWKVDNVADDFGTYTTNSAFPAGELYKTITTDEQGEQVIEYKDKEGHTILKKVKLTAVADNGTGSGYTGWMCTYYIYDNMNRLRAVVQPAGVELLILHGWDITALSNNILNEQSFRYEYDGRGRMVRKKVPGAGSVYMIYDARDRLVFSQDANQRLANQWLTTLYDPLNRPVITALIIYNSTLNDLQQTVTSQTANPRRIRHPFAIDLQVSGSQTGAIVATHSILLHDEFESVGELEGNIVDGFVPVVINAPIVLSEPEENTIVDRVLVNRDPVPTGVTLDVLTNTFYDSYDWHPKFNQSLSSTLNQDHSPQLLTSPGNYPYPDPVIASSQLRGQVTGTRVKILGTTDYLFAINFYDEKQRVIQVQQTNFSTGSSVASDITTTQYSFNGKPLIITQQHKQGRSAVQTTKVDTKFEYDDLWRIDKMYKAVRRSASNFEGGGWTLIARHTYDALGRLKTKGLGTDFDKVTGMPPYPSPLPARETQVYEYNIRGWLLGMNRDYAKDLNNDNYFGFDLGYDKSANGIIGNQTYAHSQYNGNISGTVWKSKGDGQKRMYDFTYDEANRLTGANFGQYSGSMFDLTAGVNFTVSNLAYDGNGNIKSMKQEGLVGLASTAIDDLHYEYQDYSNKLKSVSEPVGPVVNNKLGDFTDNNPGLIDYDYDNNGNLKYDNNKFISGISYNHLNLPSLITVAGKGDIKYTYDATGLKLQKVVTDKTVTPQKITTTQYVSGSVYQDDVQQFVGMEEGRIRYPIDNPTTPYYHEDYFLKDHLGNVRSVITSIQSPQYYPAATFEGDISEDGVPNALSIEKDYYNIDPANVVDNPIANLNYTNQNLEINNNNPNSDQTAISQKMYRLQGTSQKGAIGLGITLKVMAGDDFLFMGKSLCLSGTTVPSSPLLTAESLFSSILDGVSGLGAGKGFTASGLSALPSIAGGVSSFLQSSGREDGSNAPKAYINWILVDEQFHYVDGGFVRATGNGEVQFHYFQEEISKNGYLYIYCSNESLVPVYFDNLHVVLFPGSLLEETHYYPFGLTMAGISSKALGGMENKVKFQGQELSSKEFSDGAGLDMYEFKWRMDDPQTGRFWQIDPLADKYVYNSTYAFSENKVTNHVELEGLEAVEAAYIIKKLKQELAGAVHSTLSSIDNTISYFTKSEASREVASGGGASASVVSSQTKVFSTNFAGMMDYISYNNTNAGNSEPRGKVVTTSSVEVKSEASIGPFALTDKAGRSTNGVVTMEAGAKVTVPIEGVPISIGVSGGANTNGQSFLKVEATTKIPGSSVQAAAQGQYITNGQNQSVSIGVGGQISAGKTTTKTTAGLIFSW